MIPEDECDRNFLTFVLQLRKNSRKNFNKEIYSIGDRTSARCVRDNDINSRPQQYFEHWRIRIFRSPLTASKCNFGIKHQYLRIQWSYVCQDWTQRMNWKWSKRRAAVVFDLEWRDECLPVGWESAFTTRNALGYIKASLLFFAWEYAGYQWTEPRDIAVVLQVSLTSYSCHTVGGGGGTPARKKSQHILWI